MNEPEDDGIIEVLHKTRHEILSRFNGSLERYLDYLSQHPVSGAHYVNPQADNMYKRHGKRIEETFPLFACESHAEYDTAKK